jgi:hypothetical protein
MARHQNINDIVWRGLVRAGVPSCKEPSGLSRSDGKRPDGLTLIPWQSGKSLIWDVTVADTLAPSYLPLTALSPGKAADASADRKEVKYSNLSVSYLFVPLAFETLGPMHIRTKNFLEELGRRLSLVSGDQRESSFLFQRLSIALQRFNRVCFDGSFILPEVCEG